MLGWDRNSAVELGAIEIVDQHHRDPGEDHARTEHVEWIASAASELEADAHEGDQVEGAEEVLHREDRVRTRAGGVTANLRALAGSRDGSHTGIQGPRPW